MMNQYNNNANKAREEPLRKVNGENETPSRDKNPRDSMKDIKRVVENGNGIIIADIGGKKKERAKIKDTEIENNEEEQSRDKEEKINQIMQ